MQNPTFDDRPDSPCVALCSTALGDDICAGCGRTFMEVANWVSMDTHAREEVWIRLTQYWAQQGAIAPWLRRGK